MKLRHVPSFPFHSKSIWPTSKLTTARTPGAETLDKQRCGVWRNTRGVLDRSDKKVGR